MSIVTSIENKKSEQILIKVTPTEKKLIDNKAKMAGFDTRSAYILWLIRKDV